MRRRASNANPTRHIFVNEPKCAFIEAGQVTCNNYGHLQNTKSFWLKTGIKNQNRVFVPMLTNSNKKVEKNKTTVVNPNQCVLRLLKREGESDGKCGVKRF